MKEVDDIIEQSHGLKIDEKFEFDIINTGICRTTKDQLDEMVTMNNHYPGISSTLNL